MFTPQTINTLTFFYPVGNTPAVSLTQSLPSKTPADILLLGCGDLRNVLFTAHIDDRPLDVTSCDVQRGIIARNVLLLSMIIDDVDAQQDAAIWNIYYHMRLDETSNDLLQVQATKLVSLSASMEDWEQGRYGSQLKFCDAATLADARAMWSFYGNSPSSDGPGTSKTQSRLKLVIDNAMEMKDSRRLGAFITGFRSAAPAHSCSLRDMNALHEHFWKHGTVNLAPKASENASLPNPMFLTVNDTSTLHYGTDPLLGFHLAPAYTPVQQQSPLHIPENGSSQLQRLVNTAQLEFREWSASFRKHSGRITLRFFTGDAIAFANTLQHACASGSPAAAFYRDRYQLQPLTLLKSYYSVTGSAPKSFDVVDTSNLCDHIGPLNLLTAVSPLLRNKLASTLYTEVIPKTTDSRKEVLDNMMCGDTPTVSTLLALFPVEYWTNASCVSYGDESIFDALQNLPSAKSTTGQMFLRIAWKRPPCLSPSGETSELDLTPIRFAEQDLANVLLQIYVRMFAEEDWTKEFSKLDLAATQDPHSRYHRAGLAALLRLVKSRVACDWDKTMVMFQDLVIQRPSAPMNMHYFQELCAYLHLLDVYTVDVIRDTNFLKATNMSSAGNQHLWAWSNIAPVICITMKIPRQYLEPFTVDPRSFGTPTVHCKVAASRPWENLFSACQFSFGEISTTGARHSDNFKVFVTEDSKGWAGKSALVVTFYTPSWAIWQDYSSATVSFGLHITPQILRRFMEHYGPTLTIYETAISNNENVYLTKHAPHLTGFPKVPGLMPNHLASPDKISEIVSRSLTAGVHPQTGCLVNMTGRLDIKAEKHRSVLRDGARVTVHNLTPCRSVVCPGQEQPLDLFFPVPVLATNQKTRIARKSSYVEIVAQVAAVSSSAEFPTSFVYPLYLTGREKVPLAWSMSYLDLQKQPVLHPRQVSKLDWLNTHFSQQMSDRERALRDNTSLPCSPGERVRLEFKEGLFSLLIQFAGLQGSKHSVFGISNPGNGGVHILIFPNKFRIDLASRTVVLDCAVLPLHTTIVPKLGQFFNGLLPGGLVQIRVDNAELSMWKHVLPAWVERCRTDWSHGDDCEYRAAGKIPLTDQHDDAQFLCSCGQGSFPSDFQLADVPKWQSMAKKYSTRAAISPVFWAPFADEAYQPPIGDLSRETPEGGCHGCGMKQKKDGKPLLKCGSCRQVEYCSVECQRKDWKMHKNLCSDRRA